MSVTEAATGPLTAYTPSVDIGDAFAEDIAAHGPSPRTATPTPSDDAAPAGEATGRAERAADATPETETTAEPSEERLTLTKAELDAIKAEETKRQREAQSVLAREKAALEREFKALKKHLDSREFALNALQEAGSQRVLTEADVLRERVKASGFANSELAAAAQAEQQRAQAIQALDGQKATIANSHYQSAMLELLPEAAALGIPRAEMEANLEKLADADETARDFLAEYQAAADAATADKAMKRFYRELVRLGKADLQATKIAKIEDATPERPQRPQVTGRSTGGVLDQYAQIAALGSRGMARVADAFDEDIARALSK